MPAYLVVANQTLGGPTLAAALEDRVGRGDARFHVVVPATPVPHGLTWDEADAKRAAQGRLDTLLRRLHDLGADASGEIGASDPVAAACDALREHVADEVLLSTLPAGVSRWLHMDVPTRLKGCVEIPVIVLTATREAVPAGA